MSEAWAMERLKAERLEHAATAELHERSMRIIEQALGPDLLHCHTAGTWRAQGIANAITELRQSTTSDV